MIINNKKNELINALPLIVEKLKETNQQINMKKTKVDTAYHGVTFLGKVSYPYGYQKPSKQVIIRTIEKAKKINDENLLAKTNAQIGSLKNYNCKRLIYNYAETLPKDIKEVLILDKNEYKFKGFPIYST